jgi:adenosylhomocysteine nucleosidase
MKTSHPVRLVALSLLLVLFATSLGGAFAQDEAEEDVARVAIVSAFSAELDALLEMADIEEVVELDLNGDGEDPIVFHLGTYHGVPVVMVLCRVSMVPAATVVTITLEHFDVESIVFSGIAGGVRADLNIGDVAVPAQWANHSRARYARETGEDEWMVSEEEAALPNFDMIFHEPGEIGGVETWWLPVDESLLAIAEEAAAAAELEQCVSEDVCLDNQPIVTVGGSGVSGPAFVDNAEYRTHIREAFGEDVAALDMETWAVAYVAYEYGVPFIAFRSLSDLAGGGPGENQIGTFFGLAATNSARVVDTFFALLAEAE